MDKFQLEAQNNRLKNSPLAYRMRPKTLDEIAGQKHILAQNGQLYRAIKADRLSSVIFYGPSGTGKTTLACVIANTTSAEFHQLNATTAAKKDMVEVIDEARLIRNTYGRKTILFIDEIHRFNKAQQDYLLPFVEDGTVILIGATTENPYFEVNNALISRSLIYELKPLNKEDILQILNRAISDKEHGLGLYSLNIDNDALAFISEYANGDARIALNIIEIAVLSSDLDENGFINIDIGVVEQCVQKRHINYDKDGDNHYDTISAFIKSMRGSDPDAAVYYLARMLYAGEDVDFIARRIMICAAEDVGCADPQALQLAVAAQQAVHVLGMPEARIPLAEAVIYIACAPKSNSAYLAIDAALDEVNKTGIKNIPAYLQDAHYGGAKNLGHGVGYKYAHDYPLHYVEQQYLPGEIKNKKFYNPGILGVEKNMKKRMDYLRMSEEERKEYLGSYDKNKNIDKT